jgi:radical SAM superfamily enzyme YgiQ (UPF0313 family)
MSAVQAVPDAMNMHSAYRVAVCYYRTLSSQSSASVSAGLLAAHLRANGHLVQLVQLESGNRVDDVEPLLGGQFDVVFYKPNFKDLDRLRSNLKRLRMQRNRPALCLFGPFAVLNAERVLRAHPEVRAVVLPNNEHVVPVAMHWLASGDDALVPSSGFALMRDGRLERLPAAPVAGLFAVSPARDIERREPITVANIEASRGCARHCTFCHVPATSVNGDSAVARRNPNDVVAELRDLHAAGKQYFIFNDPIFGGGQDREEWLHSFADELEREQLDLVFMVYFTLNDLEHKRAMVERLSRLGLIRVFVGLESATEAGLRRFRKGIHVARYESVKCWLEDLGIVPHIGFMLFHPFASIDEVYAGIDFLRDSDELHRFGVIHEPTRVIPGTALAAEVAAAGLMEESHEIDIAYCYRFQDENVGRVFRAFEEVWRLFSVPILERIEHIISSGIFLDSLMTRYGMRAPAFELVASDLDHLRRRFQDRLYDVCLAIAAGASPTFDVDAFMSTWRGAEDIWNRLWNAAADAGLREPLSWVTTGDLLSEASRPKVYDGRTTTTRSGRITIP